MSIETRVQTVGGQPCASVYEDGRRLFALDYQGLLNFIEQLQEATRQIIKRTARWMVARDRKGGAYHLLARPAGSDEFSDYSLCERQPRGFPQQFWRYAFFLMEEDPRRQNTYPICKQCLKNRYIVPLTKRLY